LSGGWSCKGKVLINSAVDFSHWLRQEISQLRAQLAMETVIVSHIENGQYTIVAVDSDMEGVFEVGQEFPLEDTYCRAVYENQESVQYNHVATIKSMLQHPVYQAVKLESYIASPIKNPIGEVVGTLNFTSLIPRSPEFSDSQQSSVDTLAAAISEHYQFYSELANNQ